MSTYAMPCPTEFALKYPGWHTYKKDRETVEKICAAVNIGTIKINEFGQFALKSKDAAKRFLINRQGV